MILYFASMNDNRIAPWFYKNDCPLLYSQINDRGTLNRRFNSPKRTNGKLFVDSGAHSAHTKGVKLDVDEYMNFVNSNIDKLDVYVQVDKIPGVYRKPKTLKDWLEAPAISWENYKYMHAHSADPSKLMSVFHQGESFDWLKNMCEYEFEDGTKIPYIGLSPRGDVSLSKKYDFCAKCFSVIQNSSNPNVKTHALGATSLKMLERLPFYSADSTTWVLVSAFGQVWVPSTLFGDSEEVGVKLGISNENKSHPTSTQCYWFESEEIRKKLDEYFESIGTSAEKLAVSHSERSLASAKFCQNWANNYQYKGLADFRMYGSKALF